MKIDQIKYILEIYNSGSISKAAKNLYISQPNISNAVKKLEQELGFDILIRTKNGIRFTDKGIDFIRHGKYIIEQLEEIEQLSSGEVKLRFSVVAPWYPPAEYAFYKLCLEYEKNSKLDFAIRNANTYEALELLNEGSSDIGIIVLENAKDFKFLGELEYKKIKYVHIKTLQPNINFAKNHPLINERKPLNLNELWNYPYVKYRDPFLKEPSTELPFINQNKIISADSREIRSLIVSNSYAFSIGLPLPPKRIGELNLVSVPLEERSLDIGYLVSRKKSMNDLTERYIKLLDDELLFTNNI